MRPRAWGGIAPDSAGTSETNGIIIIPKPNDKNRYYVFSEWHNCQCNYDAIGYSIVNMNLEGGLGDVETNNRNVLLLDDFFATEKFAASRHGNGRDWWLITHEFDTDKFIKWLITPDSILGPFYQNIGRPHEGMGGAAGEITFSKSGNMLALLDVCGVVQVFDFDRCSGELNLKCELSINPSDCSNLTPDNAYYSCAFSPDETKFYFSTQDTLFQSDLEDLNCGRTIIGIMPFDTTFESIHHIFGQLELGPDNKIYVGYFHPRQFLVYDTAFYTFSLIQINSPNSSGLACNPSNYIGGYGGLYYTGFAYTSLLGLPNMPNYNLGRLEGSACDTLTSIKNENLKTKSIIRVYPNPASEELTIEILNGVAVKEITVTDAAGKQLINFTPHKPSTQLNVKMLSAGVYFVRIKFGNGEVQVRKFMKQ